MFVVCHQRLFASPICELAPTSIRNLTLCFQLLSAMVSVSAMKKGLTMKVSKLARKATKAKTATKASMKKPAGSQASDSPWQSDPSLAASLALVPLDAAERAWPHRASGILNDDEEIPRGLPPAMLELKNADAWNKDAMTAVPNYLQSLQKRFGLDVENILNQYKAAKSEEKRKIAKSLCLAKTNAQLLAVETTYCADRVTTGTMSGWVSAFEVWDLEKIPLMPETQALRVAALAVLERRPHPNPLRAKLGEFVFKVNKEMMRRDEAIVEESTSIKANARLKDENDYNQATANLKRAGGKAVGDGEAAPKRPKAKAKPKPIADVSKMSKEEKKSYIAQEQKDSWLKETKIQIGKLSHQESLLHQHQQRMKGLEIPKMIVTSVATNVTKCQTFKDKLNEKIGKQETMSVADFSKTDVKKLLEDVKTYTASFLDNEWILKKAKAAIGLAKM